MALQWDELLARTDGLRKSAVLTGFFAAPPVGEQDVLDILRRVSSQYRGELLSTLRAYQGGRREELEHRVLSGAPGAGATLAQWFGETFQGQPSALILNRVERWSAQVANIAASLNHALSGGDPDRLLDVECVLLIGDYGYSPFGVHLDYDTTRVVHIPLTAARKTMLLWTEAEFVRATGKREPCFDFDALLDSAERHEFSSGDVFFLASDRYHVGHSPRLTATLAVVMTAHRQASSLSQLPDALAAAFGPQWADLNMVQQLRLNELCELERTHVMLRRLSNAGLSAQLDAEGPCLPADHDQLLRLVTPFRIFYRQRFGFTVYVRGSAFSLPAGTDERHLRGIAELLDVLNAGESLSVNIATHIVRTLSADAVAYLLELLARRHALEVAPG
jgi:hypothetical protein